MNEALPWNHRAQRRTARLARAGQVLGAGGRQRVPSASAVDLLQAVIEPGDRVCLEGNNQKQADFLARALAAGRSRAGARPAHGAVGAGAARAPGPVRAAASPAGWTSPSPARRRHGWRMLVSAGRIQIGAIHTYLELFARYFVDLTPQVALIAAQAPTPHGNLYTGPNTEDTPAIVEATAFRGGIVIAQVNEMVDTRAARRHPGRLGRLRGAGADSRTTIEPLFTRDPAQISEIQVLMAMMAIKGIYARIRRAAPEPRHRLRHRGHRAAAADLRRIARPQGQDLPATGR